MIERGVTVRLDGLRPHPKNYNAHPPAQIEELRRSLKIFGQVRDIVTWNGFIVAGHGVAEAAIAEGWDEVFATRLPENWIEEKVIAYLATDNETARLSAPDDAQLAMLLQAVSDEELRTLAAGGEERLRELVGSEPPPAPEPQMDRAAELQEKWQVERGQVWEIGRHRLMCGDSADEGDVNKLLKRQKTLLLLTDPPYGIKRDEGFGGFGSFGPPIARRQYEDDWDSERPSSEAFTLMLASADKAIIFGGNFFTDILPQSNHWLVWDKQNTMPTFGDCELAWTNIPRNSVKKYVIVYNGLIGKEETRFHPTQKPVKLMVAIIEDYSKEGESVLDIFLGSGTTLVACEQTGRIGYGMEIEPRYCSVALQRLQDMGLEPRLVEHRE